DRVARRDVLDDDHVVRLVAAVLRVVLARARVAVAPGDVLLVDVRDGDRPVGAGLVADPLDRVPGRDVLHDARAVVLVLALAALARAGLTVLLVRRRVAVTAGTALVASRCALDVRLVDVRDGDRAVRPGLVADALDRVAGRDVLH